MVRYMILERAKKGQGLVAGSVQVPILSGDVVLTLPRKPWYSCPSCGRKFMVLTA